MSLFKKVFAVCCVIGLFSATACTESKTSSKEEKMEIERMDSSSKTIKENNEKLEDQTKKVEESLEQLDKEFSDNK